MEAKLEQHVQQPLRTIVSNHNLTRVAAEDISDLVSNVSGPSAGRENSTAQKNSVNWPKKSKSVEMSVTKGCSGGRLPPPPHVWAAGPRERTPKHFIVSL